MFAKFSEIKEEMDDVAKRGGAIESLKSTFSCMLKSGECEAHFNEFFDRNYKRRDFLSLLSGRNFALHENDRFMLAFGVEREPRRFSGEVSSVSQNMIFGILTPVDFTIRSYRKCVGELGGFDIADRIELVDIVTLRKHDIGFFDSKLSFVNIEFNRSHVSLNLSEKGSAKFISERYCADTGQARYAAALNSDLTRIEYACEVLKDIGNEGSVRPLRRLCAHPAHFVRWKAVEALINIDYDVGIEVIREMVTDSHPHIRAAAGQALRSLNAEVV